ncbi:MAG: tryptophanase [archaeon]
MDLKGLTSQFPAETTLQRSPRPYVNHSVEFKKPCTASQRTDVLSKVGLNVFFFPSELISGCDMLSDSGTTTMTNAQWAALHLGDEAYGSNQGYYALMKEIRAIFGEAFFSSPSDGAPNAFLFHQGRAAENALFSFLGTTGEDLIIPSNGHFDTTRANIEANSIIATDLFSPALHDLASTDIFKGNIDIDRLGALLKRSAKHVPVIYLTITNNTGGGQPVSMANIRQVSALAKRYRIPLFLDACRFAENAWFIKRFEQGYSKKGIPSIVKEMFSFADGFTISFKKDGLSNMGGGLFLREHGSLTKQCPGISDALTNHQILVEGNPTYGGMTGRDIMALVEGLRTVLDEQYLDHRISQVRTLAESMHKQGLPVIHPAGGHAVYLDMNRFYSGTGMQPGDFGGISFCALLLALYGHRACELGNFAFGSFNPETGEEAFPENNCVRFAIPRLRYENEDLESVAEAVKGLYDRRNLIPPVDVIYGKDMPLRHFKARFRFRG